ncbi:hypothetical protein [Streptomyces sp. NPDC093568]|uniref:hypothetical protein n=1 Tax=Streptomyces sp. NPDC093568 TaxID=3366041 RepID=UPI0038211968
MLTLYIILAALATGIPATVATSATVAGAPRLLRRAAPGAGGAAYPNGPHGIARPR